jgi:hypothetical protein
VSTLCQALEKRINESRFPPGARENAIDLEEEPAPPPQALSTVVESRLKKRLVPDTELDDSGNTCRCGCSV